MTLLFLEPLTQTLNALTAWLLIASLKSVPLIVAIVVIQYGFKKSISANARYSLWLSLLLCLSIPFGWNIALDKSAAIPQIDSELVATQQQNTIALENITTAKTPPITTTITEQISAATSANKLHTLLSYIWLTVLLSLFSITLWQLQRFKLICKTATPANTQQEQLLTNSKLLLGMKRKIPLLYSEKVHSPLTFGLFKPVIILPTSIEQELTQTQIQYVLLHELTHIQGRDIFWNWVTYWIVLFHWFNPLVWYASKRMKADMEIACDAKVLTHLSQGERNDYGVTLISVSQLASKPEKFNYSLGILENQHELKNRLIMIKEFTTMTLKKTFIFGLIFSAFAFTALAQPNTQTDTNEKNALAHTNSSMTLAEFARHAEKDLKTQILVGQQYADYSIPVNISDKALDYGRFLSQLKINEFTAYKSSNYIQIVPARDARWLAIPTVQKGTKYFDDEYVTDSIKLEKTCAGSVLISLRPLVPQFGYLTTMESANTLIISDFYSNIVRLKAMINMLENNTPEKVDCSERNITTKQKPNPEKK
jgi:beta-lactamase regulating signal transducer with metallopeptidase domain